MEGLEGTELYEAYDIQDTAIYILDRGYKRVALQFPDHLLKISVAVTSALRNELKRKSKTSEAIQLYVLADTTYGSCCGDEVAAAHVNAQCIIHYGHTCLSQMSKLPVWHIFGKSSIDIEDCTQKLIDNALGGGRIVLVLFDLDYAYAIQRIKLRVSEAETNDSQSFVGNNAQILFADTPERAVDPPVADLADVQGALGECSLCGPNGKLTDSDEGSKRVPHINHNLGGLRWRLPGHCSMDLILICWIGQEGPALTNLMLIYNTTTVVRYDPNTKVLHTDVSNQSKVLRRRYYLVERAKDANIVGVVVGTLAVAGYQETVKKVKRLLKEAGKKSYTLAMGKPSPSKLANFPECDIFVLVACAQTALLDSKDFMAPVITPFEAGLAWKRGSQWRGSYSLDFSSVIENCNLDTKEDNNEAQEVLEEARFSFIKGAYIEDASLKESAEGEYFSSRTLVLSRETEKALQLQRAKSTELVIGRRDAMSGMEYFAARSYDGLKVDDTARPIEEYVTGRQGRASAYKDEVD